MMPLRFEYSRRLRDLNGKSFQSEVAAALQKTYLDFQPIPDTTRGDGGVDGASHEWTRIYFCYGVDLVNSPNKTGAKLRAKIVDKFKSDMCRLLELEDKKGAISHCPNKEIADVLGDPPLTKVEVVRLVCNVFHDKAVIAPLRQAFADYLVKSKKKYVAPKCGLTIWGTDEVSLEVVVDAEALFRIEQPLFHQALRAIETISVPPTGTNQQKFDAKFDWLEQQLKVPTGTVQALRDEFRAGWAQSIGLNDKLSSTTPDIHRKFEKLRKQAAIDALVASHKPGADPFTLLDEAQARLRAKIEAMGAGMPGGDQDTLARAETGRLLGDCPLDWRKP